MVAISEQRLEDFGVRCIFVVATVRVRGALIFFLFCFLYNFFLFLFALRQEDIAALLAYFVILHGRHQLFDSLLELFVVVEMLCFEIPFLELAEAVELVGLAEKIAEALLVIRLEVSRLMRGLQLYIVISNLGLPKVIELRHFVLFLELDKLLLHLICKLFELSLDRANFVELLEVSETLGASLSVLVLDELDELANHFVLHLVQFRPALRLIFKPFLQFVLAEFQLIVLVLPNFGFDVSQTGRILANRLNKLLDVCEYVSFNFVKLDCVRPYCGHVLVVLERKSVVVRDYAIPDVRDLLQKSFNRPQLRQFSVLIQRQVS